jgi:hypothetical protein
MNEIFPAVVLSWRRSHSVIDGKGECGVARDVANGPLVMLSP